MGVRVTVLDGEPIGITLRRFKKQVERAGMAREIRLQAHFIRGTEVRRAKKFHKRFKTRKAALLAKMSGVLPAASVAEAHSEFWRRTGKP